MPVYLLTEELVFPPPEGASPEGVVAVGGDTHPERLLLAYSQGIFPWPHEGMPLLWFCPDPRSVLPLDQVHVGRSLRKSLLRTELDIRTDTAFDEVMRACASAPRPGQDGTWITEPLMDGFRQLHARGFAHSIEAWRGDRLVGGLYGISLGRVFFGESMFAREDNASKIAMVTLMGNLRARGFRLVDCQVQTAHLDSFGAQNWPRSRFLRALRELLVYESWLGPWSLSLSPAAALPVLVSR